MLQSLCAEGRWSEWWGEGGLRNAASSPSCTHIIDFPGKRPVEHVLLQPGLEDPAYSRGPWEGLGIPAKGEVQEGWAKDGEGHLLTTVWAAEGISGSREMRGASGPGLG